MDRILIVNADDCNLTPGVTRAILECHDTGIVSSTTFMANLPVEAKTVRALKKREHLGVGIHLNITFSRPVSKPEKIKSLLGDDGNFRKVHEQLSKPPKAAQVFEEYAHQIRRFKNFFGRLPTHLDTHHQIHNHPLFFGVLIETAKKYHLPLRRSSLMKQPAWEKKVSVPSPDITFGDLNVKGYWRLQTLKPVLRHLPSGVSEIMCHPGICDAALKSVSSFTAGREVERKLFRSPDLRRFVESSGIVLTHYGCYT